MAKELSRLYLLIPEIRELLARKEKETLKEIFYEYEPVEVAQILNEFTLKERVFLFSLWEIDFAADVFEKMNKKDQFALLRSIDKIQKGKILDELAPDERADFFEELPEETVTRLLSIMQKEEAQNVKELLSYESNTAGGKMTTEFISVREGITVKDALESLRKKAKGVEIIYYIYVLNKKGKLTGVLSLKDLVLSNPRENIKKIMHTHPITIPIDMDQEKVAEKIAQYDFFALPVVDDRGRMKGIITVDDVIDVIKEENTEDMYKIAAAGKHPADYMSTGSLSTAKHRFTWLLILAITGLFSGMILENFSFVLKKVISLTFFIPFLMDSAGNAGTQAATVTVRGLAIGEVRVEDIWRVVKKEFLVGIILGLGLSIFAFIRAIIFQKSPFLGLTVGITMIITVTTSTSLGSILPLICKFLKIDPAVISGPLITTIVDITSLLIYFAVANLFFHL